MSRFEVAFFLTSAGAIRQYWILCGRIFLLTLIVVSTNYTVKLIYDWLKKKLGI